MLLKGFQERFCLLHLATPCHDIIKRTVLCFSFRLGNGISSDEFSSGMTKIKENLKILERAFQLIRKTICCSVSIHDVP